MPAKRKTPFAVVDTPSLDPSPDSVPLLQNPFLVGVSSSGDIAAAPTTDERAASLGAASSSSSIETQVLLEDRTFGRTPQPVTRSVAFRPKRPRQSLLRTKVLEIGGRSKVAAEEVELELAASPSVEIVTSPLSPTVDGTSLERRERKAQERRDRYLSRLTTAALGDLVVKTPTVGASDSMYDYCGLNNFIHAVNGNFCQFSANNASKNEACPKAGTSNFPPSSSTQDCCQTFSTLSAVLLGSMEFSCHLRDAWKASSTHYTLFIAAWLHHYTRDIWGTKGIRPTAGDLNGCLLLSEFFPVHPSGDFITFFFNQGAQMKHQLELLITTPKKKGSHTCGYTIVSGDFTVAVVALREGSVDPSKDLPHDTYTLVLADSHGNLPWAKKKVNFTSVSIANSPTPDNNIGADGKPKHLYTLKGGQAVYDLKTGLDHFCAILFALLEDHRDNQYHVMKSALDQQAAAQETCPPPTTLFPPPSATTVDDDLHIVDEVTKREVRGGRKKVERNILADLICSRVASPSGRVRPVPVQYLTWSPIVRKQSGSGLAPKEICRLIVKNWLPAVVSQEGMPELSKKWVASHSCFFGLKEKTDFLKTEYVYKQEEE